MKRAKDIAILIAVLTMILFITGIGDERTMQANPTISDRLLYSFTHAGFMHLSTNIWAMLSVIFVFQPHWGYMAAAYTIAVLCPSCLCQTPTVGLSVFIYALFGMMAFRVKDRAFYQLCMAIALTAGCLHPYINGYVHIYAYACGCIVALLTTPISCLKQRK